MKNTFIKINSIIFGSILIFLFFLLYELKFPMLINATGFDYQSNSNYNTTAQIDTEDEFYYNQYDNSFYYQQINSNLIDYKNMKFTNNNGTHTINNGVITFTQTTNRNDYIGIFNNTILLEAGKTYTLSADVKSNQFNRFQICIQTLTCPIRDINSNYTNIYTTVNVTTTKNYTILMYGMNGGSTGAQWQLKNLMLSEGEEIVGYAPYNSGGSNNYYNFTYYGRMYDLKPNTEYTLFGGKYNDNTLESFNNIYLGKNCKSANLTDCEFQLELNDITYNENTGSYTFRTPNYNDYKGVYYFINNSAVNGSMPIMDTGTVLYEGRLTDGRNYYKEREQNYYIKTNINNLIKNDDVTYSFNSYPNSRGVGLLDFTLIRYNIEGISTSYNYSLLQLESIVSPNYYSFNIPNLYDLELIDNTLKGSMPSIKFNNSSDYTEISLSNHIPILSGSFKTKNQYLANAFGFVGDSLFKGFYNSYEMQGNLYNDQLVLTQNFEFKNRYFTWNQFTNNLNINGENDNQFGFYVLSLGTKNTLTDNGQITPPNSEGFGNSDYEIYNTCNGNIFEDFGCYVSNAFTWTIFNVPIIGPVIRFISQLITLIVNLVTALKWYESLGILFSLFILIMFIKILGILWKGKDE